MTFCASNDRFVQSEQDVRGLVGLVSADILNSTGVLTEADLPARLEGVVQSLITSVAPSEKSGSGLLTQVQVVDAVWNVLFPFVRNATQNPDTKISINRTPAITDEGESIVCYRIKSSITEQDDFAGDGVSEGFPIDPNSPNPFPPPGFEPPEEPPPPTIPPDGVVPPTLPPDEAIPPPPPIPPDGVVPREPGRRMPQTVGGFSPPRPPPIPDVEPDLPVPPPPPPEDEEDITLPQEEPEAEPPEEPSEVDETLQRILEQLQETEQQNENRVREFIDALQEQIGSINDAISERERSIEDAINQFIISQEGTTRIILETIEDTLLDIGAGIGQGFDLISEVFIILEETIGDLVDETLREKETAATQDQTAAINNVATEVGGLGSFLDNIGTAITDGFTKGIQQSIDNQGFLFSFITEGLTIDKDAFLADICAMISFYRDIVKTCPIDKEGS